jgi:hypothetical protein
MSRYPKNEGGMFSGMLVPTYTQKLLGNTSDANYLNIHYTKIQI